MWAVGLNWMQMTLSHVTRARIHISCVTRVLKFASHLSLSLHFLFWILNSESDFVPSRCCLYSSLRFAFMECVMEGVHQKCEAAAAEFIQPLAETLLRSRLQSHHPQHCVPLKPADCPGFRSRSSTSRPGPPALLLLLPLLIITQWKTWNREMIIYKRTNRTAATSRPITLYVLFLHRYRYSNSNCI